MTTSSVLAAIMGHQTERRGGQSRVHCPDSDGEQSSCSFPSISKPGYTYLAESVDIWVWENVFEFEKHFPPMHIFNHLLAEHLFGILMRTDA